MAEAVRQHLESQVAELEDLRRRGIFSAEEIKYVWDVRGRAEADCSRRIVRKRRAFEYALRRRSPQKSDFLRYIEVTLRQGRRAASLPPYSTSSMWSYCGRNERRCV